MTVMPIAHVPELDEPSRRILEFERSVPWRGRSKERAIRELLGISPTRYRQLLVGAVDRPEALAFDPMLIRRLRRLREARRRARLTRRLGRSAGHG